MMFLFICSIAPCAIDDYVEMLWHWNVWNGFQGFFFFWSFCIFLIIVKIFGDFPLNASYTLLEASYGKGISFIRMSIDTALSW